MDFSPAHSEVVKCFLQPKDLREYRRTDQKERWVQGQEQGDQAPRCTRWSRCMVLWQRPFISVVLDGTALHSKPSATPG